MNMHFTVCVTILLLFLGENCCSPQRSSAALSSPDQDENSSTVHVAAGDGSISSSHGKRRGGHLSSSYTRINGITDFDARPYLNKWASAGLKYFDFHPCTSTNIGSDDECFKLGQIERDKVAVYFGYSRTTRLFSGGGNNGTNSKLGPSASSEKVYAILPDFNPPKASGGHDAVMVLDPYPNATFGHLVAMFYLDSVAGRGLDECKEGEFQTLTSDGTCIRVGSKAACPNMLERFTGLQPKRCHVDFLPTVYTSERVNMTPIMQGKLDLARYPDLLECVPLPGFASCPKLRRVEDTEKVLCDSTLSNSKRCDTSHATVGSTCKLFQSCDRAILMGGGWNRAHSPTQSLTNIGLVAESLISNGFSPENVKTFYANGKISHSAPHAKNGVQLAHGDYFSSAMKTALRGHVRTTCDNRHCAETLFLYLNNPTTFEGDFLLWDVDYNGIADELETYTVKELLSDLAGCEAKRVILVTEQSNSDILMTSLKSSSDHGNVILFTGGLPNEVVTGGEFTSAWVNSSRNPTTCLRHVYQMAASYMRKGSSNPVFYDPTLNALSSKLSLVGAPCDLSPGVSSKELKTLYQGCQNVPTSIWFSFNLEEVGDEVVGGGDSGGLALRPFAEDEDIPVREHNHEELSLMSQRERRRISSEVEGSHHRRHHHRHHHRHVPKRRRIGGGSKSRTKNHDS